MIGLGKKPVHAIAYGQGRELDKSSKPVVGNAAEPSEESLKLGVARCTRTIRRCTIILVVLTIVLLFMLWTIAGLCMRIGLLPYFDLGYSWFDRSVFLFFGLS